MTRYTGMFYDFENQGQTVKTSMRETPKLEFQEGYIESHCTRQQAADAISDLLMEGIITEETFLHFINRYPE